MRNFPIIDKETGREYWISRSVAVVIAVFANSQFSNSNFVLVVQRGKGTPDPEYIGKYCMPCGYLDFDETCAQAAQRELMEEAGLNFPLSDFKLVSINDNPKGDKRQNLTFRYVVHTSLSIEELELMTTTKNSEKDEISSIRFIDINNIDIYEWAFNHESLIKELWEAK